MSVANTDYDSYIIFFIPLNMNCRLLYLIGQLHTGGSERQLCYLLRVMDRKRYKPAVAVWTHREEDVYVPEIRALGVPLYSFPNQLSSAGKLIAFRRLVRQLQPEVVHSYSFYTNFAAYWAAQGTRIVDFGSVRSNFTLDKRNSGPLLGRLCARWPRNQIFNSLAAIKTTQDLGGYFVPGNPHVVRNGIDLDLFNLIPLATKGPAQIVGVGYLLPVKQWDRVAIAALQLKRKGFDFSVRVAGDGPLYPVLESRARRLGLAEQVKFIGHVDNVTQVLRNSTFLVHTSDNEGCPNAVMEAMACGRAVVAMEAGDVPYLVEDGKTGFVVRRGDTGTLIERMATLIADRDLCRRMGQAGRAKAERDFGLNHLVEKTLSVYQAAGWKDPGPH